MIHKELNHVNVVQMHHYFEDNLNVYMLLEACPRKVSCVSYFCLASLLFPIPRVPRIREKNFATLPLRIYDRHTYSDENSTGDARPSSRKLFKPPTDIDNWGGNKTRYILLFYPSFCTRASLTSLSVISPS